MGISKSTFIPNFPKSKSLVGIIDVPMCVYAYDTTTQKGVFPQLFITVNRALRSKTEIKHVLRDVLFSITN